MPVTAFLTSVSLLLYLVLGSVQSADQRAPYPSATSTRPEDGAIKLNTRLVNLNVKVTDRSGRSVSRLTRDDFVVLEDNVFQEIAYFEPVNAPLNLVLLLDLSGSLGSRIKLMRRTAKKFTESLDRDDRIAVATFTTRFNLACDFTSDRELLKDRIDRLENPGGDTALYDATWTALDLLARIKKARKAIVVLTDGVDSAFIPDEEGSRRSFNELMTRAEEEDATVYPIYFDTEREVTGGSYTPQVFATARKQLEALAVETGGVYFAAYRPEDLDGVYQRVAAELQSLYSLAYAAKDTRKDGGWRKITVTVNRPGAFLKTRRGYYAR